ncbi:10653_t:CDS:10 [Ambispora leptoticha]|uniref:Disintegrin and metalloproteinase domain-containing protein B n=1 Tax=Ambispora leptoticha TaxID=144679 RepID=A0A9N8ZM55_9GLOM|nr:10653_t:CDS:10 [Ambispora leptoticha]
MEGFNPPHLLLVWLLSFAFIQICVQAHSIASKPLTYLEFVSNPIIERLPRDRFEIHNAASFSHRDPVKDKPSLRHDDSMRVQFVAFNQTFHLHLEPNLELYHSEAKITIYHSNNTKTISPLLPEDHRLYKGVVLGIDSTEKRLVEDIVGLKRRSLFEELAYTPGVLGWARIHVLDDGNLSEYGTNTHHPTFEGTFSYKNDLYHIKSIKNFRLIQYPEDPEIPNPSARHQSHRSATMVIYRDSDLKHSKLSKRADTSTNPQVQVCAADDLPFNVDPNNESRKMREEWAFRYNPEQILSSEENSWNLEFAGIRFSRTSNESRKLTKRDTTGCPTARKINYMGAAADCTYVKQYGSQDASRMQILNDWNTASGLYESTFNISLGLIALEIQDLTCPSSPDPNVTWNRACSDSYTIDDRLSDFSYWRGSKGNDGTGLWHLLTTCNTGSKVGVAWLGQLCQTAVTQKDNGTGVAYVSSTGVSTAAKDEWKIVAHEVGHGFGAIHDCIAETCPCGVGCQCCPLSSTVCDANGQYIMNPTDNSATDAFSPCSINDICSSYPMLGTCLGDPGTKTILSPAMCGNGIKEVGEDCDCGTDTECANDPCCNGSTCKFKPGAVCDDRNDLCCQNCTTRAAGTVCRPAVSNCDVAEVCNGTSIDCPPDVHIADGTSCGNNGLACAGGQCTSRDAQCVARGSRAGITSACTIIPDLGCSISCANPSDSHSCLELSGTFVDGTPCGYGGKCYQGSCQSGSIGNTITSWINQNKNIVIPVASILGAIILCCLLQCCYSCIKQRAPLRKKLPSQDHSNVAAYRVPVTQHSSNWVDPTPYNGPTNNQQPQPSSYSPPTTTPPYSPPSSYAGVGSSQTSPPIYTRAVSPSNDYHQNNGRMPNLY